MQKGKHQGGQTQGFPHRSYPPYPGNSDTPRQFAREVPAFHASGTPSGGPGMRGMHHAPPTQPPTPPTSQDIKQQPTHLPPQSHPMPPQSGGQMMQYTMPGAGRGNSQQAPFYNAQRGPSGVPRMAPHPRTPVIMSNNPQPFLHPQVYPNLVSPVSGQPPVFVTQHMNQSFQIQTQPRHQGGFYPQQFVIPQPQHMYPNYQQMYFTQPLAQMSRPGGSAPNSQVPGMALITGATSAMASGVQQQPKQGRQKMPLQVINPRNGRNVIEDYLANNNKSPKSGESSARQTPQPNSEQKTDPGIVAEFATKVAIAARSTQSVSPSTPSMQPQSSSRASSYSENESQASPDMQGMSTPSVSPSKLDISVENIPSESQLVENNLTYDTNQQATMIRPGWPSVLAPVDLMPMPIHSSLIISDDIIRGNAPPNQPSREYQPMPGQWLPDANTVPVPVIISKDASAPHESPIRPGPERITPVVSALAHGPTVDIAPRHQRDQFPALVKGHQQPSPVKRKQRSETAQEQSEVKNKEHQAQPAPQPPKAVAQQKPKQVTPTVESKKQSMPPSQDSDDFVQSVQTRNSETKTISVKANETDSSETEVKSDDNSISIDNNNLETRNLNEELIEDSNNRNKSEVAKSEATQLAEGSSLPRTEESSGKTETEEVKEVQEVCPPKSLAPLSDFKPPVDSAPFKANGEAVTDDAKQSNQKQKSGIKRQAQSKMRLEKDTWNADQSAPRSNTNANEVTPAAPAPAAVSPEKKEPPPPVPVNSSQPEETQLQEEDVMDEEKEKEDLIVAAKNEENNKQTASLKTNDSTQSPVIENINAVVLKHNYKQGQWSPLNPDGKKKYDRDFIMELMNDPQSRRRPANLQNLDLLKDITKQRPSDRNFLNSAISRDPSEISLYPTFGNKNSSQRSSQIFQKKGSQSTKPKVTKPPVIHMSLHHDVKLHETENAWKPTRNTNFNNMTEEEIKTDALFKRVRGVLNKLTPEKFNTLVDQVKALPIDNHERLKGVIDLVFEKAVDEPNYSVAYAQMCYTLQNMQVAGGDVDKDGKTANACFKKLLIGKCQNEFEKDTSAETKRKEEKLKEIELETDPEKKKTLQLQYEEEERRIRMKSVGNSRFIGELYKLKMLTAKIMHTCIARLLSEGDEESLECLCKLLTTVGRGLDTKTIPDSKSKSNSNDSTHDLNTYFKKLAEIVKNKGSKKVSSRVRFMIQDLIDLRNNKWVPRRDDSNPKTIDQIQKEQERETIEMNLALNSPQERNKRQDSRNSLDNRKRVGADSAGWTTIPQNRCRYVESSKLKLDQSEVEVGSTVSLGNRNQFKMWGQGLGGGKLDDKKMPQLGSNMFAVLNDKMSQPSSRNSSLKGPSMSDTDRMFSSYKSNYDDDRSSRSGSQQGPDSRSSSRDSVSSKHDDKRYNNPGKTQETSKSISSSDAPSGVAKSPEILQENAKFLLGEYLCHPVFEEAELSAKEILADGSSTSDFIVYLCHAAMEMNGTAPKRAVGKLISHFIGKSIISMRQCLDGLGGILEIADDLAIDMPFFWGYLAEIMVDLFAEGKLSFRDLAELLKKRQGAPEVGKLLSKLFAYLVQEKGQTWIKQLYIGYRSDLGEIMKGMDVKAFLKQNKLEFLLEDNDISNLKMDTIKNEIYKMIASKKDFDTITIWIDKNLSPERRSQAQFLRTLMTVLLEASVTQNQSSYKFDIDIFSNYEQLIVRYTDHCEELELPCLYAVQAFIHKLLYPQGLVCNIFEHLWDRELIAAESFMSWFHSEDLQEVEGHAVCIKSLTSFYTVLSENLTDDES